MSFSKKNPEEKYYWFVVQNRQGKCFLKNDGKKMSEVEASIRFKRFGVLIDQGNGSEQKKKLIETFNIDKKNVDV